MRFGPLKTALAEGAILAHSLRLGDHRLKKGTVLAGEDIATLAAAGIDEVVVARLDVDEVGEDVAAEAVQSAICGQGVILKPAATGRANIHADSAGLVAVDVQRLNEINALDESVTVATLPPWRPVKAGEMIATVKIITYGVKRATLAAVDRIAAGGAVVGLQPFAGVTAGLIMTRTAELPDSAIAKARRAVTDRLERFAATVASETVIDHEMAKLAEAVAATIASGPDMVLIFAATAIVDRGDLLPAAIVRAGGDLVHFGMPVDPGNLLLLARHGKTPVVGIPTCARSPKLNGFDFVLARLCAGLDVTGGDIAAMGAGGLLKEIASRPQPRQGEPR